MTPLGTLLWPFSLVFGAVVRVRAWCYRKGIFSQRRLKGVVISVGNLTVGGTGKTPAVLWIVQRLLSEGHPVGALLRGYGGFLNFGSRNGPEAQLYDHDPENARGDEVRLLLRRVFPELKSARRLVVGVGADRFARGQQLESRGVGWFVLDDGFQHLRLARDVDIVLIDATNPFGGGHLLPAGRLREPKSALARADILVITRSEHSPAVEAIARRHTDAPTFYAHVELDRISQVSGKVVGAPEPDWRQEKLFIFCGIGNPAAFFDDARRWGLQIVGNAVFRDHHRYSQRDASELERRALVAGAEALLCTEKDMLNLLQVQFQNLPVCSCRISLHFSEEERFWNAVRSVIRRKRPEVSL